MSATSDWIGKANNCQTVNNDNLRRKKKMKNREIALTRVTWKCKIHRKDFYETLIEYSVIKNAGAKNFIVIYRKRFVKRQIKSFYRKLKRLKVSQKLFSMTPNLNTRRKFFLWATVSVNIWSREITRRVLRYGQTCFPVFRLSKICPHSRLKEK